MILLRDIVGLQLKEREIMIKNYNMPAMPMVALDSKDNPIEVTTFGMTKLEAIASQQMAGMKTSDYFTLKDMASDAINKAMALLDAISEVDK